MAFIIQNHDRETPVKVTQHPLRKCLRRLRPFVDDGIGLLAFLVFGFLIEAVPVLDQHLPSLKVGPILDGNQIEIGVVISGMLWSENLQALFYRQVGAANQNRIGELLALGILPSIAECPGNQHRHQDGFPRTGRHLAAQPAQGYCRIVCRFVDKCWEKVSWGNGKWRPLTFQELGQIYVGQAEVLEASPGGLAGNSYFRQVDDCFCCLALAEEKLAVTVRACPVAQEFACYRRSPTIVGFPPAAHILPQKVDHL